MGGRLVLGCGSLGHAITRSMVEDDIETLVLDSASHLIESLRADGIPAEVADPTDPAILRNYVQTYGVVIVASDDVAKNREMARAVRQIDADSMLVVYTGPSPSSADREAIASIADQIIDYGPSVERELRSTIAGEASERLIPFSETLRSIQGPLAVFMHDHPDPDAIGSAIALRNIARNRGIPADACYFGQIDHQENRALVNLLELELNSFDPESFSPDDYGAIALVDHARPGVNDQLSESTEISMVIDHHPPRGPVEADFVDLRTDVGATSTVLTEYLDRLGCHPTPAVVTALLYGIRVDTRNFRREITPADFHAAAVLQPAASTDILDRVESPGISGETLDTIARAIRNRHQFESLVIADAGPINHRDSVSQAANHLLSMDGTSTSIVYGIRDGIVSISARSVDSTIDIGEVLRDAFDRIGSAGGHTDMAGAQIPLGMWSSTPEQSDKPDETIIRTVIINRLLEVIETGPQSVKSSWNPIERSNQDDSVQMKGAESN